MFLYATLTENADEGHRADIDAFLDGRDLPSDVRKREERTRSQREFVRHARDLGGDVG